MEKIRQHAAGIDIGAKSIFVAVSGSPVVSFTTFTEDFERAARYLLSKKITSVAMEATGSYWLILHDILAAHGLDVWLVDGRQTKQVPGRKTDVKDCQWIQQIHSYGLLNRCFVPDEHVKQIRTYQRLREDHLRSATMHINHMQKALVMMNIRLKEVLSQIHGKSGQAMIQAILDGERDPEQLVKLCHRSVLKTKRELLLKALVGHFTASGLFALRQAQEGYLFYQMQISACDAQIESGMKEITSYDQDTEVKERVDNTGTRKPIRHNKPDIQDLGGYLMELFGGKDATCLPGITDKNWLQLFSEVGSDLTRWPSEKHFTSWCGLAPGQHHSGKMKKNRNKKYKPVAGQIFKMAAQSLIESKKIGLGAYGRKLKAKKGPGVATKAVARKLAIWYWNLMVKGKPYVERGIEGYEQMVRERKQKWLEKTAQELNIQLIDNQALA